MSNFAQEPRVLLGDETEHVLTELGVPRGAQMIVSQIPAVVGADWRRSRGRLRKGVDPAAFTVEYLGVRVPAPATEPPPWPYSIVEGSHGRYFYQLWLRRLRHATLPCWVEARWHPDRGAQWSVEGLQPDTRPEQIETVWQARELLDLVLKLDQRGRPTGSGTFENHQQALSALIPIVQELRKQGKNPTKRKVLDYLGGHTTYGKHDEGTLLDWIHGAGHPNWTAFLNSVP